MKIPNTYSLLVNSEEKGRSIFENAVYGVAVLCMTFSVFTFASQIVTVPRLQKTNDASVQAVATNVVLPTLNTVRG